MSLYGLLTFLDKPVLHWGNWLGEKCKLLLTIQEAKKDHRRLNGEWLLHGKQGSKDIICHWVSSVALFGLLL